MISYIRHKTGDSVIDFGVDLNYTKGNPKTASETSAVLIAKEEETAKYLALEKLESLEKRNSWEMHI
jgi:hypothetical protein